MTMGNCTKEKVVSNFVKMLKCGNASELNVTLFELAPIQHTCYIIQYFLLRYTVIHC